MVQRTTSVVAKESNIIEMYDLMTLTLVYAFRLIKVENPVGSNDPEAGDKPGHARLLILKGSTRQFNLVFSWNEVAPMAVVISPFAVQKNLVLYFWGSGPNWLMGLDINVTVVAVTLFPVALDFLRIVFFLVANFLFTNFFLSGGISIYILRNIFAGRYPRESYSTNSASGPGRFTLPAPPRFRSVPLRSRTLR